MSDLVNAEFTTIQLAPEVTAGTLAVANWKEFQVNPGGLSSIKADLKFVRRNPLSKHRQTEVGEVVGLSTAPSITHDLNKDLVDFFGNAAFLSTGKHTGNTGMSVFRPTAVTSTGYTVAALGALTARFLVKARGFSVAGNNGVKLLAGTSTGTEVKTAGLAAETVSGYTALLEVCGWRGAAGDIGIDSSGNLTSTASVFTGWNLTVGQWIWVGGETAGTSFVLSAYRGWAKVKIIAAGLITLERRQWTVGAAETGGTQTIDVYFGRFWRNVNADHADSLTASAVQPNFSLEVPYIGAAAAAATSYAYGLGLMVNTLDIDAPDMNKVTATIGFVGNDMAQPSTTRATGAVTSEAPIATALLNTADHVTYIRVANQSDDTALLVDIESWKLKLTQNVKAQNQQASLGTRRKSVGKVGLDVDMKGYMVQDDIPKAARDARLATFGVGIRNDDGAVFFDVPTLQVTDGTPDFPEDGPVMISTTLQAGRDATYNVTLGMSTIPYAPAA